MSDGGGHGECINSELQREYAEGKVDNPTLRAVIEEHLKICEICECEIAELSYRKLCNFRAFRGIEE